MSYTLTVVVDFIDSSVEPGAAEAEASLETAEEAIEAVEPIAKQDPEFLE